MKHETRVRLVREALAAAEVKRPPLYGPVAFNDPAAYTSTARADREAEVLFRQTPLVAGFSSQVRNPGDWIADTLAPVPLLVARQSDGTLRAFRNACRHRGTRVAEGSGCRANGFTCPYHAWSYGLDGRLEMIPDEQGFPDLDRERLGLVELPVAERYGIVWVLPDRYGTIDLGGFLGGLADDLDSYGFDSFEPRQHRLLRNRINWKLASDTFWEAYHLKVLHRKTVAPLFLRNVGLFEPFGPHHRFIGVRASVLELRERPEREWDLLPHATILMSLFPNAILIMQSDHAELFRIFPVPGRLDESVTDITLFAPGADDPWWEKAMDLIVGVLAEDYGISETIQQNLSAGSIDRLVYGRFEAALAHFHASIRDALGEKAPDSVAR